METFNTNYGYYKMSGLAIKFFEVAKDDVDAKEVNEFLEEYEMNIIDIKPMPMLYGVTKVMVVYKAWED